VRNLVGAASYLPRPSPRALLAVISLAEFPAPLGRLPLRAGVVGDASPLTVPLPDGSGRLLELSTESTSLPIYGIYTSSAGAASAGFVIGDADGR
jgi:hypothetical protein